MNKGGEKMLRKKKAQSTLEYVLLIAAVALAFILVAQRIGSRINTSGTTASNIIGNATDRLYANVTQ